uniref:DUF4378 domain-containing protein n=1 Tax=Oryza punctata TaxID=4537 RepID=A0A0E0K8B9_ORYPU
MSTGSSARSLQLIAEHRGVASLLFLPQRDPISTVGEATVSPLIGGSRPVVAGELHANCREDPCLSRSSFRYPNIAIAAYCWISLATSATMLQYLDFSHASTSRKWSHKRQGEGFEAPRNSMEFTLETPQSYGVFQEDVPYSCNMRQQYPKAALNHNTSPIKRIIHEDISFRTSEVQKRPSVIARLMGMDSPPLSTTAGELAAGHSVEKRQDMITTTRPMPRRDPSEMVSTKHVSFVQHKGSMKHAPKQAEVCAYDDGMELFGQLSKAISSSEWAKPQPREHPQEEELQKFKKDFEAWQASRMWEQSRALELESHLDDDDDEVRCMDVVPYRFQHRGKDNAGKHTHSNGDAHWRRSKESGTGTGTGTSISGSRTFSLTSADASSTRLPLSRFYYEEERLLSPKRIVILKPCPEMSTDDIEESSLGSPELVKKENNMEAFLEEVKKRLKVELEGRMASDDKAGDRWAAAGDIPVDPKQIARSIANQIRETVTKDLHPALLRSESTRSYRSDVPLNGQSQMDYICRDARKHLSDRLKNVLRREPETEPPLSHRRRTASASFDEEPRPKPRHEVARKGKIRSKEEKKHAIESDVRSFRRGHYKASPTPAIDSDPVSPRNLIRSFSAPVSGTTFVKLLSEEPRVLTGARLQRKQEGYGSRPPPPSSSEERKGRKDTFNIKGRVSNLRQNLGLRAKLFGKKLHSADESPFLDDLPPIGTLVTAPSVLIHPGVLQENSTEVPPSPASWCSSPPDEMSRGGYPSPVSPLEASFSEHRSPLKMAAMDMSSSASEPEHPSSEQAQTDQELAETSPIQDDDDTDEIDSPIKAYIRAVLVIAGLYGQRRSSDHVFSDREVKPIPAWVFEEVESSLSSASAPATTDCDAAATGVDHRLLFDLINESLPRVVQATTTLCVFSRWYGAAPRRSPGGKRLLDGLWSSVQAWLAPPPPTDSPNSVDELIGRDLSMSPWNGPFRKDVGAAGAEMEAEILDELVDETLWDVLLNVGD